MISNTSVIKEKKSLYGIILLFIIVLLPVLSMYKAVGSFSFADAAIILIFIWTCVTSKGRLLFCPEMKPLFFLAIWIIISWAIGTFLIIVAYSVQQNALVNSFFSALRVSFYYIFASVIVMYISDWISFFKVYRFFVIVFSGLVIVQYLYHMLTGRVLLGYFTFIPLMNSNIDSESLITLNTYSTFRPYSVFTEPGMFVRYVFPYIAVILFDRSNKLESVYRKRIFKYIELVFVIAASLLSVSGQGIIILGILLIIWLFDSVVRGYISKKFFILFLLIAIVLMYFSTTETFRNTLIRIDPTRAGTNTNSFGTRIYRGFLVYNQLPVLLKIFGFGYGNQEAVLRAFNIVTAFDQSNNSGYMNAAAFTLVNTGVVGFITMIYAFLRPVFSEKYSVFSKSIGIMCLFLSFIGASTVSITGILLFIFLYGFNIDTKETLNKTVFRISDNSKKALSGAASHTPDAD